MIETIAAPNTFQPTPLREDDDKFVPLAAEVGARFAPFAAEHDLQGTFVDENYPLLRESGLTRLIVPEELGGLGASLRQTCYAQAELARYCGSTALAVNMHLYLVATNVYRWKHAAPGAEAMLKRVVNDGLILMTSGGSDGLWPTATAVKVDGGYLVSGRKAFCSQAPIANVLVTLAAYDDPDEGRVVLAMGIPTSSPGLQVVDTWDALGMRGTGSHDVQLDDVFVADGQVAARRPWGRWDVVFYNAIMHFAPLVASVYYGVAVGARNEAVRAISRRPSRSGQNALEEPSVARLVGLMDHKLRVAWWALMGSLAEQGDDFDYALSEAGSDVALIAKRCVVTEAVEVVELAMEAAGGSSYFKRSPIERAYRDVHGGTYHPLPPEKALIFTGRRALGLSVEAIW